MYNTQTYTKRSQEMKQSPKPSGFPRFTSSPDLPNLKNLRLNQEFKDRYARRQEGPQRQEDRGHHQSEEDMKLPYNYYYIEKNYMEYYMAQSLRKIDTALVRLNVVEMKMVLKIRSKPGHRESLAIGVASAASVRGIWSVFPHVLQAIGNIWAAVSDSSKS